MSKLLISEQPLQVLPTLATIIGVNEAIVLQQLHYWIEKSNIIVNNKKWVYNTFEEWHKQFPFWSLRTLKNVFISLQKQELIIAKQLSKDKFDKTNYYSINYVLLEKIDQEITAKKLKELEEKSVNFLEDFNETIDSANIAQSTNQNESIDSANIAQSRECKSCPADSANIAQSYIVKSFDRDYLTETTTENTKLSPKSSLKENELEIKSELIDHELIKIFIAHRKEIKHPMTQQSLNLFIKKLEKLSEKNDLEELVNEAIINGWRSVFPPKANGQTKSYSNPTSSTIRQTFAKLEKLQKEKQNYIEGEIQ